MDPNANLSDMREIVANIFKLWDKCDDDGRLTNEQAQGLAQDAYWPMAWLDRWLDKSHSEALARRRK